MFTQEHLGRCLRDVQGGLAPPSGSYLGSSLVGLSFPPDMVPGRRFPLLLLHPHPYNIWYLEYANNQTMFSSEIDVPTPKGVTASVGVATRNSWLQCMVFMFPTSSFTSYVGMPSATWRTTTYSVSLHRSFLLPLVCIILHQYHVAWYQLCSTCGSIVITFLLVSLAICLEMSLNISFLEASPNLCDICWHVMGVLISTHHQEVIINREERMPPKHQVVQ